MKRFFEGASALSAIFLVVTTALVFIFNVNKQEKKAEHRKKAEKKEYKHKKRIEELRHQQEENKKFYEKDLNKVHNDLEREKKEIELKYENENSFLEQKRQEELKKAQEEAYYWYKVATPGWHYTVRETGEVKVLEGHPFNEGPPPMPIESQEYFDAYIKDKKKR